MYYSTTLQEGSKGYETSLWQKYLQSNGYYDGAIDGNYGPKTVAATKAFQKAHGLTEDGIAGDVTLGKAGFTKFNYTPTIKQYETGSWDDSTEGKAALDAKNNIFTSIYGTYNPEKGKYEGGFGPFTFSQADVLEGVKQDIDKLKPFSYNIDEDALYQQYKDKYVQQAKLAMADTMGQAAAMTGGYGSSYAQSVGQQAYQGQLDNLNDIIPELYQMALDKYTMDKDALYDKYGMLISEYNREYGEYGDKYKKLLDQLGITTDEYWQGRDAFNTEQNNTNNVIGMENSDAWKQADWEEDNRRDTLDRAEEVEDDFETGDNNNNQPVKEPEKEPTKEPETVTPTETEQTKGFINSHMSSTEFMQRGGTSKTPSLQGGGGRSYAEYKAYITAALEKAWPVLSNAERAYLIEYYKL